jgi:hypothetical protein
LKKGKQKKIIPNSKTKKRKVTCKKKTHFLSESDLPTHIDDKEFYDDDISVDGGYFTAKDECLTCVKSGKSYGTKAHGTYYGITRSAAVWIHLWMRERETSH